MPHLADAGVLSKVDPIQLGNLCWHQAYLERCMAILWREGPQVRAGKLEEQDGLKVRRLVPNPMGAAVKDAQTNVNRLCAEFGLTVRARAALGDTLRNGNVKDSEAPTPATTPNPRLAAVA